jgi:hypothetical protein
MTGLEQRGPPAVDSAECEAVLHPLTCLASAPALSTQASNALLCVSLRVQTVEGFYELLLHFATQPYPREIRQAAAIVVKVS